MPRNSTGVYSLPTGYLAVSGQTAKASQHNPPLEDIATALTQSVASDGRTPMTGALTLSGDPTLPLHAAPKQYVDALASSPWADLASAATTDLSTVTGGNIRVTGTATITSLGTAASGVTKLLRFAASLTITHNATSLICFGGANIITAAGDIAEVRSLGSGNWVMTQFDRFSGLGAWTTIASAATVDLGAQTSRNIALSGTTGITSFGSTPTPDNVPFNVRATGAITLTHSANLICPGGANLTLATGDTFTVVQEATGVWRIINVQLATNPSNIIPAGTAANNLVRLTSGSTTTGTYARTGTTVTVTITAHGYTTGQFATLTFTTGTATSGTYQVTSTGANTFTVVDTISGATSGNVSAQGPVALPAVDGSLLTGISSTGRLLRNPQYLTSGTSYTTPAGCNYVYVVAIGGGGGGKASNSSGSSTGRGGSGGRTSQYSLSVAPNTTYNYSIGAGGGAGSLSGGTPGSGGNTVITLAGFTITAEGSAGTLSNGFDGGNGGPIFGAAAGNTGPGSGGLGYGAGGAGSFYASSPSAGIQGIIVIWEYAI